MPNNKSGFLVCTGRNGSDGGHALAPPPGLLHARGRAARAAWPWTPREGAAPARPAGAALPRQVRGAPAVDIRPGPADRRPPRAPRPRHLHPPLPHAHLRGRPQDGPPRARPGRRHLRGQAAAGRSGPVGIFTSGGRDISSSPYGPYWRLLRRNLAAEALSPARVAHFAAARRSACDGLVSSLRGEQERQGPQEAVTLRPLLRRAMFELLVFMCFGARLDRETLDEVEDLLRQALLSFTTFPVFAFFPAVTKRLFSRRWAAYLALRRKLDEVFVPLIHAKRGDGDPPCYAESLLAVRVADDERLTDAEMVSLCSEFLNGGTDTTVTLLEWIMAELVNRPDVQAKVYEEVKANPELNDLQAMPYLKATVLEGLRLHPPGHFLLPHGVQQSAGGDAEIGDYTVPKDADVNFLVAEIGRDETVWTAAREFRPERFLEGAEGHGVDITGSREIKMMPFGAGRRMCPGYSLGMHHAEYFLARMVRELQWRPPVDGVEVDMAETGGHGWRSNSLMEKIVPYRLLDVV